MRNLKSLYCIIPAIGLMCLLSLWRFRLISEDVRDHTDTANVSRDRKGAAENVMSARHFQLLEAEQASTDARLLDVASRVVPAPRRSCGNSYLRVTGAPYGEHSNMLLSIVHGIALADWASEQAQAHAHAHAPDSDSAAVTAPSDHGSAAPAVHKADAGTASPPGPGTGTGKNNLSRNPGAGTGPGSSRGRRGGGGGGGGGGAVAYTLLLPHYVTSVLFPFDTAVLSRRFCVQILACPRPEDEKRLPWLTKWVWQPIASIVEVFSGSMQQAAHDAKHLNAWVQVANTEGKMPLVENPPASSRDVEVTMSELFHLGLPEFAHVWRRVLPKSTVFSASAAAVAAPRRWAGGRNAGEGKGKGKGKGSEGTRDADPATMSPTAEQLEEAATYDHAALLQKQRRALPQVARTYVGVVGTLWGSVYPALRCIASSLVRDELGGQLGYYAVHKRHLAGFCRQMMAEVSQMETDFPEVEAMFKYEGETGVGRAREQDHPVCNMPPALVHAIISGHIERERNGTAAAAQSEPDAGTEQGTERSFIFIYVSSDGRTEESEWLGAAAENAAWRAVISTHAQQQHALSKHQGVSISAFLDIYMASHAQKLFIGNPRSTFSFQIAALRTLLGKESWPEAPRHDIYFAKPLPPEQQWLSLRDIKEAIKQ